MDANQALDWAFRLVVLLTAIYAIGRKPPIALVLLALTCSACASAPLCGGSLQVGPLGVGLSITCQAADASPGTLEESGAK